MAKSMSRSDLVSTKIDRAIDLQRKVTNAGGKILSKAARLAISAFGSVVSFFALDWSSLWDTVVNAWFTIKEFDWNSSDKEIEKMIQANNRTIATRAAGALGEQLGFGVVRLANFFIGKTAQAAAGSIKVPVLSARIGLALAEEQNEEAMSAVRGFIGAASAAIVSNQFLNSILYLRRNELFGQKSITNDDLPNGSLSERMDRQIEKLPEFWRRPAEEFVEGFEEGLISAGYVVNFTIDDHLAALQYAQQEQGPMRTIELLPEDPEDEVIEISAPQGAMPSVIPQVLAVQKELQGKDIGQILGEPIDDRAKPQPAGRFLQITFCTVDKPPIRRKGKLADRAVLTIPDVEGRVGWGELKSIPKFTRGPVYCHLRLSNGRRMSVWAASESEGENLLTSLAKFSKGKVVEGSFRSSKGSRANAPDREPCYPFFAALVTPPPPKGSRRPKADRPRRVEIWRDKPPKNFAPL